MSANYPRFARNRAIALLLAGAACATAAGTISPVVLTIEASNASGEATFEVMYGDGDWDPNALEFTWNWTSSPIELRDPDTNALIARVLDAFVQVRNENELSVNLSVEAGTSQTSFWATSPLVSFIAVPEEYATCRAVASVSIQDTGGGPGSYALAVGIGPTGIGIFRAYYNGLGYEGERFTDLVGYVYAGSGGSASGYQADPAVGYRAVGSDVYSLSTLTAFTLTATDRLTTTTLMGFSAPDFCPGDLTGDGAVDIQDLGILLESFGADEGEPLYDVNADFDRNDSVDLGDLSTLLTLFGSSCS